MSNNAANSVSPRPFLKWAGGKSKLISQYIPFFPQNFNTYYEPFLGGGAIFFHLLPKVAVLSDINPQLINVYCCVRDNVESLIALLEKHQEKHDRDFYYWMRSQNYQTSLEKAARLIYLNKTCFNGLYRENSQGQFNVPMGKYKKPLICQPDLLRSVSRTLQSTEIQIRGFTEVLPNAEKDDFVYFDPPYYPISTTSNFTAYSRYPFTKVEQIQLKDVFVELSNKGVKVMLSNSDCEFIRELYKDFQIKEILATRAINSQGNKRGKITEVLVMNYSNKNF
ncbi:DNA methyltransferase [[Phormidium ambiguum] IAM M-71]|uniref:Site-specific DNA-methyltransferase (adenine-specific) n=1 Tax=[Phormidium ambiguum] IAM M-71 TaxID=454136 RepID=A0A1U7I5X8_9CYAN|nr:DNA adenine methylase [Phormidium ambiguum]OKH31622.1 DNA methyltransferase [Phormidium ambiguum IAM M-71]